MNVQALTDALQHRQPLSRLIHSKPCLQHGRHECHRQGQSAKHKQSSYTEVCHIDKLHCTSVLTPKVTQFGLFGSDYASCMTLRGWLSTLDEQVNYGLQARTASDQADFVLLF